MDKKEKNVLISLLFSTVKIGLMGFGGGSALIPIIQKTLVEDKKLVNQTEYEEDVVIASVTPGALPVEISGCIGRRVAGWKGMLIGSFGMAFPGVFLTLLFLSVMSYATDGILRQIQFLTVGITAFISVLLTEYILGTISKEASKVHKCQNIGIILLVFLLVCGKNVYRILGLEGTPVFALSNVQIFVFAFLLIFVIQFVLWIKSLISKRGLCKEVYKKREATILGNSIKKMNKEIAALAIMLLVFGGVAILLVDESFLYLVNGFLSSIMSFGGGDAYLTVAEGLFVENALISEDNFYGNLVPLVNVLPGSILCKTLSGIGFYIGMSETGSLPVAYMVAMAGFACSIFASCGVVSVASCFYSAFRDMKIFVVIRQIIRPIVAGLMLNVILSLVYQNCKVGTNEGLGSLPVIIMFGIYILNAFLYRSKRVGNGKNVLISIVMALTLCNLCVIFFGR